MHVTPTRRWTISADGRSHKLSTLYFYLTEGCNLACRHCWLAPKLDPDGTHHATLPVERFETAIREARPLGLQRVKLTGGEPLLHPRIGELLEIVRREALGLTVETNGVLCTPALAAEMAKLERRFVSVSLDGSDAATHEDVRGVEGCFEASCQGVRTLVAAGIRPQIIFSVLGSNVHQVDEVVRLAEELGAGSVKFNLVQPIARGEKLHQMGGAVNVGELIDLGRHVDLELAPTTGLRLIYGYPHAFRPLSRIAAGDNNRCGIFGILGVIPSGRYALCGIGEQVDELVFGTVGEDRLEAVWHQHPILRDIRDGLPDRLGGVCSRCLMRRNCLGSCIAETYYRTGGLWDGFWFCEEAHAAGLFPPSRLAS